MRGDIWVVQGSETIAPKGVFPVSPTELGKGGKEAYTGIPLNSLPAFGEMGKKKEKQDHE